MTTMQTYTHTHAAPGARTKTAKDARVKAKAQVMIKQAFCDWVRDDAKKRFGNSYTNALKMAKMLAYMSDDATNERFSKLAPANGHTFGDIYETYEGTEKLLGRPFIMVVEPTALSFDDFVNACSKATTHVTISPACPACGAQTLNYCTDFIFQPITPNSLEVVCECLTCGLEPTLEIDIVKPQNEHESLTRSYIRSLLAFEGYNKDHGLGPIHDSRVLASVAEQAAKALVHLPDSFSTDYQQLVLEEMQR